MGAFNLDGKLFKGLTKAGDFVILGLLFAFLCVPVITIGGSATAAFYSGVKLIRDEENYVFKDFFKSLKRNFVQGFLIELVFVIVGLLLLVDARAAYKWAYVDGSKVGMGFLYIIAGIAIIAVSVLLYSFAMLSRYDNTVFNTIKNALIVCVHHLPQTIVMLIITLGLSAFSTAAPLLFMITIPVALYADCFIFARIFKQLEIADESTEVDKGIEADAEEKVETEE